eukprot:Nk52_evm45s78 gene=Nk52_evmTU45s78
MKKLKKLFNKKNRRKSIVGEQPNGLAKTSNSETDLVGLSKEVREQDGESNSGSGSGTMSGGETSKRSSLLISHLTLSALKASAMSESMPQLGRISMGSSADDAVLITDEEDSTGAPILSSSESGAKAARRNESRQQNTIGGTGNSDSGASVKSGRSGMSNGLVMKNPFREDEDTTHKVIAVHNYTKRSEDELSFRREEVLKVLDRDNPNWWRVQNTVGQIGFVPSNYLAQMRSLKREKWFHGNIKRADAERRLRNPNLQTGTFLVRSCESSSDKGSVSLSIKVQGTIKHYKISKSETGQYFISQNHKFNNLTSLVRYYKEGGGLHARLLYPCPNPYAPATIGLSHDAWEISRSELKLIKRLGGGHFGEVWEGVWRGNINVAVKTFNTGTMSPAEFLAEARIMKKLCHPKLLQMMAVCSKEQPMYIVTELMANGNLLNWVRAGKVATLASLADLSVQIVSGMMYLESKNYIHRDLAARNVLVGTNGEVKIADFGMSKCLTQEVYSTAAGTKFPVKWSAPEVIFNHKFTSKSDVWAFGILLWEIVTYGAVPYPNMTNRQVGLALNNGYVMPCPDTCPEAFYTIMRDCWHFDADARPRFATLYERLEGQYLTYCNKPDEKLVKPNISSRSKNNFSSPGSGFSGSTGHRVNIDGRLNSRPVSHEPTVVINGMGQTSDNDTAGEGRGPTRKGHYSKAAESGMSDNNLENTSGGEKVPLAPKSPAIKENSASGNFVEIKGINGVSTNSPINPFNANSNTHISVRPQNSSAANSSADEIVIPQNF